MIDKLKEYFSAKISIQQDQKPKDNSYHIKVATCALLIEMASIDDEFSENEKERIIKVCKSEYGFSEEDINELFALAQRELDSRIDLWGLTNLINKHYDTAQKMKVVEMIWEVVYADGNLSAHEDYLIHKFYKMLNLSHEQMIESKMAVKSRNQQN